MIAGKTSGNDGPTTVSSSRAPVPQLTGVENPGAGHGGWRDLGSAAAIARQKNDPRPPNVLSRAVVVRHDRFKPATPDWIILRSRIFLGSHPRVRQGSPGESRCQFGPLVNAPEHDHGNAVATKKPQ